MNDFLTDAEPTKKPSNSLISDSISTIFKPLPWFVNSLTTFDAGGVK